MADNIFSLIFEAYNNVDINNVSKIRFNRQKSENNEQKEIYAVFCLLKV